MHRRSFLEAAGIALSSQLLPDSNGRSGTDVRRTLEVDGHVVAALDVTGRNGTARYELSVADRRVATATYHDDGRVTAEIQPLSVSTADSDAFSPEQ